MDGRGKNINSQKNLSPGSPGRKPGGRAEVIRLIDNLLTERKEDVKEFFTTEFDKDIGKFLKEWVYKLLPKSVDLKLSSDEENPLTAILKIVPPEKAGSNGNGEDK